MKINVLGIEYEIVKGSEKEFPYLEQADGFTDNSIKRIVIRDMKTVTRDVSHIADFSYYEKKVTRHEIIHAFMYESGLWVNSHDVESWATDEEMTDFFAIQGVKIYEAWREAKCL